METEQPAVATRQGKQREAAPNVISVSNKRNSKFYVYLGKQLLREHGSIELHALGNAVSTSVQAAENLVRYVP